MQKVHNFGITLQDGHMFSTRRPMTKQAAIAEALADYPSNRRPLVRSIVVIDPVLSF